MQNYKYKTIDTSCTVRWLHTLWPEMFMSFLMHVVWNYVNSCTFPSTLYLKTLHNEAIHSLLTLSGWTIRGTVFPDTQSVLVLRNVCGSNDL